MFTLLVGNSQKSAIQVKLAPVLELMVSYGDKFMVHESGSCALSWLPLLLPNLGYGCHRLSIGNNRGDYLSS